MIHDLARRLLGPEPPLSGRHAVWALAAATASLVGIGYLDYVTGPLLSVELLYLVPVAIIALLVSRAAGIWMTLASAVCWLLADVVPPSRHIGRDVVIWNLVIRSSIFCLIVVLLAALKAARAEADASSRRSREFLASAAHQLRAPIAGVRASAEATLLRGAGVADEELLGHVATEATRAAELIAAMLSMARLDDGQLHRPEVIDVVKVCADEVERWQRLRPDLCVRIRIAPALEATAFVSHEALADTLANLLDNAVRHARGEVDVTVYRDARSLVVAVADDGPGIPEGASELVFERFLSLDGRGGAGLGLAIARSLVTSQGGSLVWDGRQFVIRLPRWPARRAPRLAIGD